MKFSALNASAVAILTTSGTASNENFIQVTTFLFQEHRNPQVYGPHNDPFVNKTNSELILGLRPAKETSLQSNAVSHWLDANLESALNFKK